MAARNLFDAFDGEDREYVDPPGPGDDSDLDQSMSEEEEFVANEDLSSESDTSSSARSSDSELDERGDGRDSGPDVVQSPRDRHLNIPIYRGKDGQIWYSEPTQRSRTREQNIFNVPTNKIPDTRNKNNPADIFGLFLTQEMMHDSFMHE